MEPRCGCGAVGHVVPPDAGYEPTDVRPALLEWTGGNIGTGRIAVEEASPGVSVCPVCHRRPCFYIVLHGRDDGGR
jgi:hypothetical protein